MRKRTWILLYGIILLIAVIIWIIWGNFSIQTTQYTVSDPEIPDAFHGFRIVHVSDLHNTSYGTDNQNLLKMIQDANPDMIVVTGDLIDYYNTDVEISSRFMEEAVKIAPCYYVYGNHEVRMPNEYAQLRKRMKACGVSILEDRSVPLEKDGQSICIAGLMDYVSVSSQYISNLFREDMYTILLTHRPDHIDSYTESKVDLVLCGHTHGGQVRLPFIGSVFAPGQGLFPEYDSGMFQVDDTTMIISQGLGNSSIPVRINCRPELVIIDLKCE